MQELIKGRELIEEKMFQIKLKEKLQELLTTFKNKGWTSIPIEELRAEIERLK